MARLSSPLNQIKDHYEVVVIGSGYGGSIAASRMARAVRQHLGTTWGLSETGATGPTGNRYGDAAGHACIAVAGPVEQVLTVETRHSGREANMWMFTAAALELLETCLKKSA